MCVDKPVYHTSLYHLSLRVTPTTTGRVTKKWLFLPALFDLPGFHGDGGGGTGVGALNGVISFVRHGCYFALVPQYTVINSACVQLSARNQNE